MSPQSKTILVVIGVVAVGGYMMYRRRTMPPTVTVSSVDWTNGIAQVNYEHGAITVTKAMAMGLRNGYSVQFLIDANGNLISVVLKQGSTIMTTLASNPNTAAATVASTPAPAPVLVPAYAPGPVTGGTALTTSFVRN